MNLSIPGLLLSLLLLLPITLHAENMRYSVPEPHRHNVYAARFTPDGTRIVSVDDDGLLIEWDFINKRILRRVKAPFTPADMGVALTRSTAKAAFVGKEGKAVIYDLATKSFTAHIMGTFLKTLLSRKIDYSFQFRVLFNKFLPPSLSNRYP